MKHGKIHGKWPISDGSSVNNWGKWWFKASNMDESWISKG
jgi:hypothetical protein